MLHELAGVVARDERVLLSCHNEAEKARLTELLTESAVNIGEDVQLCVGRVHRGFRWVGERLIVLSDHELFGRTELRRTVRRRRKTAEGRVIAVQVYPHLHQHTHAPVMEALLIQNDQMFRATVDGRREALTRN